MTRWFDWAVKPEHKQTNSYLLLKNSCSVLKNSCAPLKNSCSLHRNSCSLPKNSCSDLRNSCTLRGWLGEQRYHVSSITGVSNWYWVPALVAQLDALSNWRPGGRGFNPHRGWQHSFSMVILSLPLIQEGQLSVSGERMCTILVNRLED